MINRSIKSAIYRPQNKRINTDEFFRIRKESHEFRNFSSKDNCLFECYLCGQDLYVSTNIYGSIYLKHFPNSDDCVYKREGVCQKEIDEINRVISSKESPRHIFLKNLLYEKLNHIDQVENVRLEEWIINRGERRKPDVYCEYKNKRIAFEVQCSQIPKSYISERASFYFFRGIYLFWIFDQYEIRSQKQFEKDIKYMNEGQNLFSIDENSESLRFICYYKEPFIRRREVHSFWKKEFVFLDDLTFENRCVYYYDFPYQESCLKEKSEQLREDFMQEMEMRKKLKERLRQIKSKISTLKVKVDSAKQRADSKSNKVQELNDEILNLDDKILQKLINKYLYTMIFIKDRFSDENSALIDSLKLNKERTESHNRELEEIQSKINNLNGLKLMEVEGFNYKVIPNKYKSVIKEHLAKITIYSKNEINSLFPKKHVNPSNDELDSMVRNYEKFVFLYDDSARLNSLTNEKSKVEKNIDDLIADLSKLKEQFKQSYISFLDQEKSENINNFFQLNEEYELLKEELKTKEELKDELVTELGIEEDVIY